jgi:trigger factor
MEVRSQLEELGQIRRKLTVEIPEEQVEEEFEKVARRLQKSVGVPGFRKGKAPLALVKRRFAADIRDEVVNQVVPQTYREVLEERGLIPAAQGELSLVQAEPGLPLTFSVEFEVLPGFDLPPYRGLEVEIEEHEVTDADVDSRLGMLRERFAELVDVVDRTSRKGDEVRAELRGVIVGGDRDGETVLHEEVPVLLGEEGNIDAFDRHLTDVRVGDRVEFEVTYPLEHAQDVFAGQTVRYEATVTSVKEKVLPELDDDFAKGFGVDSLEKLREVVRQDLESGREQERARKVRSALREKILQGLEFEVPGAWVESRLRERLQDIAGSLLRKGVDPSRANVDWRALAENLRPEVVADIRWEMVLDRIADAENVEISENELAVGIEQLATLHKVSPAKVRADLFGGDGSAGREFQQRLRRQKALTIIESAAVIRERRITGPANEGDAEAEE